MNFKKKRIIKDLELLEKNNYQYEYNEEKSILTFVLKGPKDSLYESGEFKISITFPDEYPFKSPGVGFITKIYHPNVDERSGSICLDVLNQKWSCVYNLWIIYESFLPQLLLYPNPDDPLNHNAARLMKYDHDKFKYTIKQYMIKHCDNYNSSNYNSTGDIDV